MCVSVRDRSSRSLLFFFLGLPSPDPQPKELHVSKANLQLELCSPSLRPPEEKRIERKKPFRSVPVFFSSPEKQNSVAQKDRSYASHPNREKPHGPSCFVAGAKTGKKQQKATKSSRNPPGMSGFSLAAEKRGASAECVGVDLRQSRGRNMIVSLRAVDWSNASRSDLEHEGERPQLQVLCIRISS